MKMNKLLIAIISLVFITGCNHSKSNDSTKTDSTSLSGLDTIIMKSQKNFELTNQLNKQSDSMVTNKVEKTAEKITNLETQVTELKKENNELKEKLNDATDDNGKPFKLEPVSPN